MKVCTDACVFGAWVANKVVSCQLQVAGCLDIGTGTGLLSLMTAQKNSNVIIDAIEIEQNAFEQAKENFKQSLWNDRLNIFHADIKEYEFTKEYDLIFSNPPFFENDLKSDEQNKNVAKHDESLTLEDLINIIKNILSPRGYFAILLPYHRVEYFINLANKKEFYLKEKLLIKQTPSHNFFRGILLFSANNNGATTNELTIKNEGGNYSDEFINLLKDYYLNL